MKNLFSLYVPLSLILILLVSLPLRRATPTFRQTCATPASVEEACKSAADKHSAVSLQHCISALGSDPRSHSADLHGLAAVAVKLAIDHATSTESKIDDLIDLEPTPSVKERLSSCLEVYSDAVDSLRNALDNLNARLYDKATNLLTSSLTAAESCEKVLEGAKGLSSVVADDRDYGKLASIALGITASVE
ncbi:putative invertase inhibitor [Ananas comosus]|uniref:Invertase inhibitor n=1 Tax=Ananas comosus TaxID=4615 RepID=A0A6P5FIM6_ANACO|nr:putative invertase inhibitor [Ananas comosus]